MFTLFAKMFSQFTHLCIFMYFVALLCTHRLYRISFILLFIICFHVGDCNILKDASFVFIFITEIVTGEFRSRLFRRIHIRNRQSHCDSNKVLRYLHYNEIIFCNCANITVHTGFARFVFSVDGEALSIFKIFWNDLHCHFDM